MLQLGKDFFKGLMIYSILQLQFELPLRLRLLTLNPVLVLRDQSNISSDSSHAWELILILMNRLTMRSWWLSTLWIVWPYDQVPGFMCTPRFEPAGSCQAIVVQLIRCLGGYDLILLMLMWGGGSQPVRMYPHSQGGDAFSTANTFPQDNVYNVKMNIGWMCSRGLTIFKLFKFNSVDKTNSP